MRIEVKNDKVVCVADDWKKLSKEERHFLADCYWTGIWTSFNADGDLEMGERRNARSYNQAFATIALSAGRNGIEISPEVETIRSKYDELARLEREEEERLRGLELRRENWEYRKKRGCAGCKYSLQVGDAWFRCQFSGDELDSRFSEEYNPVTQAMEIFHEVGVPNEHCKYNVNERIIKFGGKR